MAPAGRLIEIAPDAQRPAVHRGAKGDVEPERRRADPGHAESARAAEKRDDQADEHDAGEVRIEDEHPVERIAMAGERNEEHRAEGGDPVEENVRRDSDRGKEPEQRERGLAKDEPAQQRESQ